MRSCNAPFSGDTNVILFPRLRLDRDGAESTQVLTHTKNATRLAIQVGRRRVQEVALVWSTAALMIPAFRDGSAIIGATASMLVVTRSTVKRCHSSEFKTRVVADCEVRGASVAGVSLAHGVNANLVRKWIIKQRRYLAPTGTTPLLPVRITTEEVATIALPNRSGDVPQWVQRNGKTS